MVNELGNNGLQTLPQKTLRIF